MAGSEAKLSRRAFLSRALAASAALTLGGACAAPGKMRWPASLPFHRPPNFIVILVDDMGYQDIGCFGSPLIRTPRLDHMAAEGVRFTSFYAQPVCSASRASLLTGCYPLRVGIPGVLFPASPDALAASEITIAEVLKQRGYATACIGKWHLGHKPGWLPTDQGFDSYYGIPYSNDMGNPPAPPVPLLRAVANQRAELVAGEAADENAEAAQAGGARRTSKVETIEQPVEQDTITQRYTREALRFITANRDRPFFLYLPHTMVHVPLHASADFRGKSPRGRYGDAAQEIDWSTGQILDTLDRLGLDDNTLVVFTSDNGPWLDMGADGGCALPLRGGKFTTWEGGMREPCIMRWPGRIPAGTACGEVAATMDLLPTLAHLADAEPPRDRIIDGRDIWPLMAGKKGAKSPHEALFYYWLDNLQAVRSGRWKLVFARPQEGVPQALYDLDTDVSETTDVAAGHPEIVARLTALAEQCRDDLGDAMTARPARNRRPVGRMW